MIASRSSWNAANYREKLAGQYVEVYDFLDRPLEVHSASLSDNELRPVQERRILYLELADYERLRKGLNRIQSCQATEVSMRSTQQFSITLPNEMAELVRAKVATGEYATESEVVRDGLRTLLARDRAVEDWLREKVAPAYDALKADPSRAVSVDQVRAALSAQHRKATAKSR
jgi:putative addiction module CopG family antidote